MAKDSQGPASVEPTPRKIVTKRLRFEIFRRDDFACRYCGLIDSVWRYMCGVAWRTLEQLQADAKALLVGADAEA